MRGRAPQQGRGGPDRSPSPLSLWQLTASGPAQEGEGWTPPPTGLYRWTAPVNPPRTPLHPTLATVLALPDRPLGQGEGEGKGKGGKRQRTRGREKSRGRNPSTPEKGEKAVSLFGAEPLGPPFRPLREKGGSTQPSALGQVRIEAPLPPARRRRPERFITARASLFFRAILCSAASSLRGGGGIASLSHQRMADEPTLTARPRHIEMGRRVRQRAPPAAWNVEQRLNRPRT